jgi:hypothetical protein
MDEEKFVLVYEHGSKHFVIFFFFQFSYFEKFLIRFLCKISKYFVMFDFIVSLQTALYS